MLAFFPAGRDDPANRGRFVLKLIVSFRHHLQPEPGSLIIERSIQSIHHHLDLE
ncbi:hypothetical protein KP13_04795 [Klebsiella pneumoniae subsp. pneumoniae Kp13]|nr:hypothetical protein KP13_04795 [Klebsiella pneumoniae subsp. pneumoniae Kp13]